MAIGELTDEDAHLYGSVDEDRIFRWIMDVAARLAAVAKGAGKYALAVREVAAPQQRKT